MNPDYVKDVRSFAAAGRLTLESGRKNNSHEEDFPAKDFRTDGKGNIEKSPLVYRKRCVGRVERKLRGEYGRRVWVRTNGERGLGDTACDTCAIRSPGIYEACGDIVAERIESSPAIEAAFEAWTDACGEESGPRCFTGSRGKLWHALLQTIIDHGGWTNVNDDQVKLEALRLQQRARDKRNAAARDRRRRDRDARRGTPKPITPAYLQALNSERDRRAASIKRLGCLSGQTARDMLWLKNLPDYSCERIADVWRSRELLSRGGHKTVGKSIAEQMIRDGRSYGLELPSLTTRVYDDLKRIAKLEKDSADEPIWARWIYSDSIQGGA